MPIRSCLTLLAWLLLFGTSLAHTPHDAVAACAISPTYQTDGTLFCSVDFMQNFLLKSTDGGETWSTAQKGISARLVSSLAFSPDFINDSTLLAGTKGGELFKTTNAGASWELCNQNFQGSKIRTIVFSPDYAADRTVLCGTENHGVFRSVDGGATWADSNAGLGSRYIFTLAISPDFDVDQTIFVGTANGLCKSIDGGATWFKPAPHVGFFVTTVALSPEFGQDNTLFVGTWGQGVYCSTDGGNTWYSRNKGLTELEIATVALSPDFPSDRLLLVGTRQAGIFKSTNHGATWIIINEGLDEQALIQTTIHYFDFQFSPGFGSDRTVILVSFEGLHKSEEDVTKWRHLNIFNQNLIRSVACSPEYATDGTVFAGAYGGGLYRSRDNGDTWEAVNTGSHYVHADPVVISPTYNSDSTVFAGYYLVVQRSTNGGASWQASLVDPNRYIYIRHMAISPGYDVDQTLFAINETSAEIPLYKSIDGGVTFDAINVPHAIFSIAISPDYPVDQTFFVGTRYGVFRSNTGGSSFDWVGPYQVLVNSLGVSNAYTTDGTVFAGTLGDGILRTTDHCATWQSASTGLGSVVIESIALSPDFGTDGTIFATTKASGVFKSVDKGNKWIHCGMEGKFVHRIAVSPNYSSDQTIFLGTWNGVVRSTDGGATWARVLNLRHYDQKSEFVYYYGTWETYADPFASGASLAMTDEADAQARLYVSGTSIKWIGERAHIGGIADVFVDGVHQGQVDLYSPQPKWQEVLFSATGLAPGSHSIRIVATGTKNPASQGTFVFVDAFEADY